MLQYGSVTCEKFQTILVVVAFLASQHGANGIQCYSCKGSGPNEVEANIRCLESAYLENCDDFYQYYSEVENAKVLSYEYYYYDDGLLDELEYEKDGDYLDKEVDRNGPTKKAPRGKVAPGDEEFYDYKEGDYFYDYEDTRKKRDTSHVWSRDTQADHMTKVVSDIVTQEQTRQKRQIKTKRLNKKAEERRFENEVDDEDDEEIEYEYEYEEVEEYDYENGNASSTAATTLPTVTDPSDDESPRPSPTMPKEPEHYCYSETKKDKWESYTVEKGCKKIMYCKESLENHPEWSKPWNFCCDRARCNAKLVKDKPQRIFGMGCRRTDDCIQGYNSRPVCPNFFQSCPRISTSLIKMECRVKSKTMASVKNAARFQHMFREKKCYCAKGYFPRGPICTSGATTVTGLWSTILISIVTVITQKLIRN